MNDFDLLVFSGTDEMLQNYDDAALADDGVVDAAPIVQDVDLEEDVPF